jgi:hypothetical protein
MIIRKIFLNLIKKKQFFFLSIIFSQNIYAQFFPPLSADGFLTQQQKNSRIEWCNTINIEDFTKEFLAELANQLQVDPRSFRIYNRETHSVEEHSGGILQTAPGEMAISKGVCKISISHSKGVYTYLGNFPEKLWVSFRKPGQKREPAPPPPPQESKKDYSKDYPHLYTPPGMIRNKRGQLVYY